MGEHAVLRRQIARDVAPFAGLAADAHERATALCEGARPARNFAAPHAFELDFGVVEERRTAWRRQARIDGVTPILLSGKSELERDRTFAARAN